MANSFYQALDVDQSEPDMLLIPAVEIMDLTPGM